MNPLRQLTLAQLRTRSSEKWRTYPADVLPLFVAEMDVPLAEPIVRAVTDAVRSGDTGYPAGSDYAEAMAEFARERWGWDGITVRRAAVAPDVMYGIVAVLRAIGATRVVINSPVYAPFHAFIRHLGGTVVEAPLDRGRLDLDALRAAFRHADAYLLCSPHNPTGTVHTTGELTAVAELAARHGVRVIADEIHAPLVLAGATFTPYLSVADDGFSVLSASKAWNLAGLKAGLVIAGPAAAERIPAFANEPSHVGVIAHTTALREGGPWLDDLLAGLAENRRLLGERLAEKLPAVHYQPGEATYLAWLDCRELGLGDDPAAVFLDRARVALNSGPTFGTGGAGHVRLNFATSPEVIEQALDRMGTIESCM
ncbi:aminotransferase class I/II-fold pyridoxal phosphate-dependent enzyme [Paractinoplanes ferrugineus]|uniref:cysteine-S-conjugate beta-lyase n=1 Tax=Paractinoplanes ferrugineus TaxID=113564 RepID=A0A919J995_9ACTN|nr:aminotransferase class I/II-fold pyridoxal phosphate-dependent enzyme [Actinoplanes ferrugineus]GIE15039.1 cystathionine beta-lyase [Actinoplanes ferrugineus]